MSTCRSCGADVRWLKMQPGGKSMPIDVEPHPDGNILPQLPPGTGVVLSATTLAIVREQKPNEPRYRSHFATCPDAAAWRSKR